MSRFVDNKKVETPPTHRRMGTAFDLLAKTLRNVGLIIFANGFNMRNRPGMKVDKTQYVITGLVDVKSVTELFYEQPSTSGINAYILGRTGNGLKRNLHFADISVDHRTEIGDSLGYVNGVFRVRASRDGEDATIRDGLYVFDRGSESASRSGTVNWLVAAGEGGQVRLSYMPDADGNPLTDAIYDIYISSRGITLFGVPTSSAGLPTGGIWNDAGTLKIV